MIDEHPIVYEDGLLMSLSSFKATMKKWDCEDNDEVIESLNGIKEAYVKGIKFPSEYDPADFHVGIMYGAHHNSALRTLAFVGAYAPSIEGLLKQQFASLQEPFDDKNGWIDNIKINKANFRWKKFTPNSTKFWSVDKFVTDKGRFRTGIVDGFAQLRDALSIESCYEEDDIECFEALVAIRNEIFHNGYYWPYSKRKNFEKKIDNNHWDDFFSWSREGGELGICFLTDVMEDKLFDTCLGFVDSYTKIHGLEKDFGLKRHR